MRTKQPVVLAGSLHGWSWLVMALSLFSFYFVNTSYLVIMVEKHTERQQLAEGIIVSQSGMHSLFLTSDTCEACHHEKSIITEEVIGGDRYLQQKQVLLKKHVFFPSCLSLSYLFYFFSISNFPPHFCLLLMVQTYLPRIPLCHFPPA